MKLAHFSPWGGPRPELGTRNLVGKSEREADEDMIAVKPYNWRSLGAEKVDDTTGHVARIRIMGIAPRPSPRAPPADGALGPPVTRLCHQLALSCSSRTTFYEKLF